MPAASLRPPTRAAALARDPAALAARLARGLARGRRRPGDVRVVHAPGRVNLIGEHTDYNEGFVLPVAIDLGIAIALVPTDDRRVEMTLAATGETLGFDLDAIGAEAGRLDRLRGRARPGRWRSAGADDPRLPGDPRLGPAAGLGALELRGPGAGVVAGAVAAASCRRWTG